MRKGRILRHPVVWITRGSDAWYTLAAALANAIIVTALARFIGGEPISERRILLGSVAYSICIAATFSVTGFLVGDASAPCNRSTPRAWGARRAGSLDDADGMCVGPRA